MGSSLPLAKGLLGTGLGAHGNRQLPSQVSSWFVLSEDGLEDRECPKNLFQESGQDFPGGAVVKNPPASKV